MSRHTFITYTHPGQQASRANRRRVLHRNRSAPASRRAVELRPRLDPPSNPGRVEQHTENESLVAHDDDVAVSLLGIIARDRHGIREDPFQTFPVFSNNKINSAIDYYIHSYAPAHFFRPEILAPDTGVGLVRQHFQYSLRHPTMFKAILALAWANMSITGWTDQHADRLTLHLYGQAVAQVRQDLFNPERYMTDAILFAIMALIGVNYLLNDLSAFGTNLAGLRRIVMLRGGIDALGWPDLLKPALVTLESFWAYFSSQAHLIHRDEITNTMPVAMTGVDHVLHNDPHSSSALQMLPRLPEGFRILAERGHLGRGLLSIIHDVAELDSSLHHEPPTPIVHHRSVIKFSNSKMRDGSATTIASSLRFCEQLARLFAEPDLTTVERTCCLGMLVILTGSTRSEQLSSIYFTQLQHHARELLELPLVHLDSAITDLAAWTMFNVASTMVPPRFSRLPENYRDDLRYVLTVKVVGHFSATRSWEEMQQSLSKFIWSSVCVAAWKNVWDIGMQLTDQHID